MKKKHFFCVGTTHTHFFFSRGHHHLLITLTHREIKRVDGVISSLIVALGVGRLGGPAYCQTPRLGKPLQPPLQSDPLHAPSCAVPPSRPREREPRQVNDVVCLSDDSSDQPPCKLTTVEHRKASVSLYVSDFSLLEPGLAFNDTYVH